MCCSYSIRGLQTVDSTSIDCKSENASRRCWISLMQSVLINLTSMKVTFRAIHVILYLELQVAETDNGFHYLDMKKSVVAVLLFKGVKDHMGRKIWPCDTSFSQTDSSKHAGAIRSSRGDPLVSQWRSIPLLRTEKILISVEYFSDKQNVDRFWIEGERFYGYCSSPRIIRLRYTGNLKTLDQMTRTNHPGSHFLFNVIVFVLVVLWSDRLLDRCTISVGHRCIYLQSDPSNGVINKGCMCSE